ncbi:Rqc2 family fibronectin-binding protein [Streptococcus sp. DD12]|uniref:Rqc2 family fibronectin-binding protein n=1 Tax=Streptococcus sp. DD12 TaxID=1777880 RepID=UPI00079A499E|nr:NFACT RNA binding domain-containing protein [Streptococcus sp. DD12]KXT76388.1 Fibronectin/fibrinogen-binding protein [Streptococcus sp. DD12]
MSFDGFFLHHMTQELKQSLEGGRIQKINQLFAQELVLTVRNHRKNWKFLLSAHPTFSRVQLTQTQFQNPQTPTTYTMLMRKYLQGALIQSIEQLANDRILRLAISNKNEIGDDLSLVLIIEIMGKHSNIILIDEEENKILEAIKHVGFSQNSYRTILPGSTYVAPPAQDQANPFTVADESLFHILKTTDVTANSLQKNFQGLGRDTASLLAQELTGSQQTLKTFRQFFSQATQACLTPKGFFPVSHPDAQKNFDSLSDLLDTYYLDKAERDRVNQQAHDLILLVKNQLNSRRKKLLKQEQELAATDSAETFRQYGELLTTFLHQVPNDQDSVSLVNYYTNEEVQIPLDKALTPNQNAQRYFKRYQKLKEAVKHLNGLISETSDSIRYLESVETALEQANLDDIQDIRQELITTGFLKKRHGDKQHKRRAPESYLASDGQTLILVGRNNLQNDELSFKLAKKDELWFHAKDIPGSHVVIRDNLNPSDEVKTDAAELAAYYSKARHSNLVQVDMITAKKLHKPKGGNPGFVTYRGQKTLRVTPNAEKIDSMRQASKR